MLGEAEPIDYCFGRTSRARMTDLMNQILTALKVILIQAAHSDEALHKECDPMHNKL
jgi:hypothetical protein